MRVIGRSAAGHPYGEPTPSGFAAIRILTGAAVPGWADVVAMQEDCAVDGEWVTLPSDLAPGAHIREAGEAVSTGAVVLHPGDRVRPQDIGIAASVGYASVPVFRKLRVAVFATGDELRPPGASLPPGCIHDSNRFVSSAVFRSLGFDVTDLGIVADDPRPIKELLTTAAAGHDLVVTSGGVSEGDEDHVVAAVRALGSLVTWKLAVKPGKPVAVGRLSNSAFVGLPGNPVAALVALVMVARPLALRLAGSTRILPHSFPVATVEPIQRDPVRRQFLPGKLERQGSTLTVRRYHTESSGVLRSLTWSDGLVNVEAGSGGIPAGGSVEFFPYAELFA